ncbi:toll/interleukin-1 receptor domain-containing protein [Streptomyces sp. AK02-01A]|uniref:toll/interleukin-1 receptor domain-containing protein n=1 Tax=Streptomyces sp. AK02-01A TaxID=3028648 RepID=UPI0029B4313F|nr:toll/interleukin-1 receptor domain-containing protein [Streptomyces sp. AK02-01A]MDX3850528.1 toll/interleukin-1 receptor domain-containing protein [Streptomyces sp. AK02-01A]
MANYFITSFAAGENESYTARFHNDLVREVEALTGKGITAAMCGSCGGARPNTLSPAADTGVMVSLCSELYYTDHGCGWDWALFERRLERVSAELRPASARSRVLVRWQPADPPPGLPRAPVNHSGVLGDYALTGLLGIMRRRGWNSEPYRAALREIAAAVRTGHAADLPPLPLDDRSRMWPAFPSVRAKIPSPGGERSQEPLTRTGQDGSGENGEDGRLYYISYARADQEWASWVDYHIRELGQHTEMDIYDWQLGQNSLRRVQDALQRAHKVIALISPAYLNPDSPTASEWGDALAHHGPDGTPRFTPLLIRETELPPLLRGVVTAELAGLSSAAAVDVIAAVVAGGGRRRRPTAPPPLPAS